METSTDSVLSRHDPAWDFYEDSTAQFGSDEIVVLAARGARPFDVDVIRRLAEAAEDLGANSAVRRVDGLTTVPVVRVTEAGHLELEPVVGTVRSLSEADEVSIARSVQEDRILRDSIASRDGRTLAIVVRMESIGAEFDEPVVAVAQQHLRGLREGWISGGPVFRTATNRLIRSEVLVFVPLAGCLIFLLLFFVFGGAHVPLVGLGVGGLSSAIVAALMGYLDVPLTISTVILPSTLLALGCAYVMHMAVALAESPMDPEGALVRIAKPVALSGATTAIGFAAMSLVRIDVIRSIGGFGALGVLIVLSCALSLSPAVFAVFPPSTQRRSVVAVIRRALVGPLVAVSRHRAAVLAGWGIATGLVGVGILRLEVETDVVLYFTEDSTERTDYNEIRERLSGISPMNVVVQAADGRFVTEPVALQAIDALTAYLSSLPDVGKAISVGDPLRQIHGGFMQDPDQPLPTSRELVEQYLVLLESVEHISDVVSPDRRTANVMIRADNNGSNDLLALARRAETWWDKHGPAGYVARVTGIMHEYARSEREIERGQLRGLAFALLAVGGVLLLVLGSPTRAALAMVPNVVPVVSSFGLMGLLGVPLDAGTVLLGSLALGIAVDDTIHLVAAVGRHEASGATAPIEKALSEVVPAISITTAVIAIGFGVLSFSEFSLVRNLGMLTAVIMVICYLADVLLLPALMTRAARQVPRGPG